MMQLEIDDRKLRELIRESDNNAKRILSDLADDVIDEWQDLMEGTDTRRDGRSQRGNPPAVDVGDLVNSLHKEALKADSVELHGDSLAVLLDDSLDRPFIDDGLPDAEDVAAVARRVLGG